MSLVEGQHYQLACVKYFEVTHGVEDAGFSLQHPNQYFQRSREIRTGGDEATSTPFSKAAAAATPAGGASAAARMDHDAADSDDDLAAAMDGIDAAVAADSAAAVDAQ
jgi:hypothetical protein